MIALENKMHTNTQGFAQTNCGTINVQHNRNLAETKNTKAIKSQEIPKKMCGSFTENSTSSRKHNTTQTHTHINTNKSAQSLT